MKQIVTKYGTVALFAAVLVLALAAGGAAAMAATGGSGDIVTDGGEAVATEDVQIDTALEEAEGETRALVYLSPADVHDGMSPDAVIDELQAQADATQPDAEADLAAMDGVEVGGSFWIVNALSVTYDADTVSADDLASADNVVAVYENHHIEASEPIVDEGAEPAIVGDVTYGLDQINAPDFWDTFGTQGDGATIVIQDDGFDLDHEALEFEEAHQLDGNGNIVGEPAVGEHGTHVAGTAAGTEDPDGVAFGVAPDAELHGHDIFSADDVVGASIGSMQIAAEMDADVVSGSWGSGCNIFFPDPVYNDEQIDPVHNTRLAGTEVVSSSGNSFDCVGGFANDFETFGIGASNQAEEVTDFSSGSLIDVDDGQPNYFGDVWNEVPDFWPQSWIEPRVAAPGEDVYSSVPGDGYDGTFSGTSMSSPHVAGSIALIQSATDEDFTGPEIREALIETAWKPDDWDPDEFDGDIWTDEDTTHDQPGFDSRYGSGIIDPVAAVEFLDDDDVVDPVDGQVLGDITGDGQVGLSDAILVQEAVAGVTDLEAAGYDVNMADMTRNNHVTLTDAILLVEEAAGIGEGTDLQVMDLITPAEEESGAMMPVDVELENQGATGALQEVKFYKAPMDQEITEDDLVMNRTVDMAVDGVVNPVVDQSWKMMLDEMAVGDLDPVEYQVKVTTENSNMTTSFQGMTENFEVENLDAPESADDGETIMVSADITNTGNLDAEQDVEFRFDNLEEPLLVEEDVFVPAGESVPVTFEVPIEDIPEGTYEHGIFTDDDSATAEIDIFVPFFEVVDIDGPTAADHGDEILVDVTIENTGGADGEQIVTYLIDDESASPVSVESSSAAQVAVVGAAATSPEDTERHTEEAAQRGVEDVDPLGVENLADTLQAELGDDFNVETVPDDEMMENADEYDVWVFNDFGAGADDLSAFLDELDDDQGTVYLENWGTSSDAITELALLRDGLETGQADDFGGPPVEFELLTDHAVFDGVGNQGDRVEMYQVSFGDKAWFTGYDGDVLADVGYPDSVAGSSVGVDDDRNEALLSLGRSTFVGDADYTDEANTLLANAVEEVTIIDILEAELAIPAGEQASVEFEFDVTDALGIGERFHTVETEDDIGTAPIDIDSPERIEITDLDAPDEVMQTETVEVTVTVEHQREQMTTQDVEFLFDGEVVDSEEVTLGEGESTEVMFELETDTDTPTGTFEHGAQVDWDEAFATIEITEAEDPEFQIIDADLPATAGQAQNVTLDVEVENLGDLEGTQDVLYELFAPEDDEPGDPGPPDEPDVDGIAVVDDERNTDQGATLAGILDDEFDDVEVVENTELLDVVDEYELFVIQRFDSDGLASDFLDELTDNQGVVYMDTHQGASEEQYPDGVLRMHNVRDDPGQWDSESLGTDTNAAEVTITDDHPIFDGVGDSGDTVVLNEDTTSWGSWFDSYSGDVIADVEYSPSEPGVYAGSGIGVNDANNEVLLNAFSYDFFSDPGDITEAGEDVLINAVTHVASQAGATATDYPETTSFDDWKLDAESADELPRPMQDGELVLSTAEELTLAGGESDTVQLEFTVPENLAPDTYDQVVSTDDDSEMGELIVEQTEADIEVSAYFLDPDPAEEDLFVGDTLSAEAVVANHGDRAGEFEVKYYVGEEVVDNQTVEVGAGDVKIVDLEHELREAGKKIISVNGVDPVQITVQEPEPATYEVSNLEPEDATVDVNEEFDVSATVTNTGMVDGEKDVELRLDGATVETVEDVAVDAGDSQTVTFEDVSVDEAGEYEHSVWTEDDEATGDLTVEGVDNALTFNDQELDDGEATVSDVTTAQNSTIAVTYEDGENETIAGLADADNLDGEDVQVEIEDDGGFPGEHTAWLFDDDDVPGDIGIGDDASPIADDALDSDSAEISEPSSGELTFNDQELDDGEVTVENVSSAQNSTIAVTYEDGDNETIAGLADADNLDGEDVQVEIEDAGGSPGVHTAWLFDDDDVPGDIGIGDDASPIAGDALDSDSAEVSELESIDVAVVGSDAEPSPESLAERGLEPDDVDPLDVNNMADTIAAQLAEQYVVETVSDTELLANVENYDVFVINDIDDGADDFGDFLDALSDDQGAVYLEGGGTSSDGIERLSDARNNPETVENDFEFASNPIEFELTADHELFDGVGDENDRVEMYTADDQDRGWFEGYSGDVLAEIAVQGESTDGPSVGVEDDENEVLLSLGRSTWAGDDDFTDEANTLLGNAVEYVAELAADTPPISSTVDSPNGTPVVAGA